MLERDEAEHPVPRDWQATFERIVEAFLAGDFQLRDHSIENVASIDPATANTIIYNISAYGDTLEALSPASWERSIYIWQDGYWLFLVDLSTEREKVSDLTLHARLFDGTPPRLEVQSVHVP